MDWSAETRAAAVCQAQAAIEFPFMASWDSFNLKAVYSVI